MANSRIMLVCKHCGKDFCIGKGYFGSYSTSNDELHKQLNIFYGEHEHGCCSEDTDCSDNARNHFAILEEGEDLDVLAADVVPKSEVENLKVLLEMQENAYESLKELYDMDTEALIKAREKTEVEVAREIFEEIESKKIFLRDHAGNMGVVVMLKDIAELKKKYTEEKE